VTYPHQSPRPGPPPGGYRPSPPPAGQPPAGQPYVGEQPVGQQPVGQHAPVPSAPAHRADATSGTGHPAVDAVLQALANAAALAPGDQIAEYEAAHQVLQETLAGIDR